jgi:peptide/nickel transport system permease protein
MLAFTIRRTLWTILVLFTITVLTYLIFFATPGVDPARQMAGRNPDPQTIEAIRHEFGLDRPLPIQYALLMKHMLVSRDLISYTTRSEVIPQIAAAAPVTISLVLGAAFIWVVLSIATGMAAAVLKGTLLDPFLMVLALVGISMPVFWLGEMANLLTQSRLHNTFLFSWVPPLGYVPLTENPWEWFKHLIIPWVTLSILYIGFYARVLRANLLEIQNEDYIRTARAKGLSERRVILKHGVRSAITPLVTIFGIDVGTLLGGAILTETVFNIPGIGRYAFAAIQTGDLPVVQGTVIFASFFIVFANLLVDIAYAFLDPRVRYA